MAFVGMVRGLWGPTLSGCPITEDLLVLTLREGPKISEDLNLNPHKQISAENVLRLLAFLHVLVGPP